MTDATFWAVFQGEKILFWCYFKWLEVKITTQMHPNYNFGVFWGKSQGFLVYLNVLGVNISKSWVCIHM